MGVNSLKRLALCVGGDSPRGVKGTLGQVEDVLSGEACLIQRESLEQELHCRNCYTETGALDSCSCICQ